MLLNHKLLWVRQKLCPDGARNVSSCSLLPTFCPDGAMMLIMTTAICPLPLAPCPLLLAPCSLPLLMCRSYGAENVFSDLLLKTCRSYGAKLISPYSLLLTPYSLLLAPCSLLPAPCSLHLAPCPLLPFRSSAFISSIIRLILAHITTEL